MKQAMAAVLLLSFGSFLSSCDEGSNRTAAQRAEKPGNTLAASRIPTQSLQPKRTHIQLASLPKPFATQSAARSPKVIPPPADARLRAPSGFEVNVFAADLERPRWLALSPEGDVLVTEPRRNRILRLVDSNRDGVVDARSVFADKKNGLDIPFGMAFTKRFFFLGNHNALLRFAYKKGQGALTGKGKRIAKLPGGGYRQHWTRNVLVSADGAHLFVAIGSRGNAEEEPLPRASIQIMKLDGSQQRTFAFGLRNPVGLALHPKTRELHTTVNERDLLGDDLVPDFFTRVQDGEFFGWPYAYLAPNLLDPRQLTDGKSKRPDLVARTKTPDVLFQSHSAPLGLVFYTGSTFPQHYRNGAFIAFRGSWNRSEGTGYKIVFVPFGKNQRPLGYYEDFLTGFLLDPSGPTTWGRPVGLLVLLDGSMLLTEEMNGRIYRIQHTRGGS